MGASSTKAGGLVAERAAGAGPVRTRVAGFRAQAFASFAEFGQFNDIRHAAREGARFAAVNAGDSDAIRGHVCAALDAVDAGITQVDITLSEGSGLQGATGSIRVVAHVDSISAAPLISVFLPAQLASEVDFRLEQDADDWASTVYTDACP